MGRNAIRLLVSTTVLILGCPGNHLDLDAKTPEAPPTVTAQELAAVEVSPVDFCTNGEAAVDFTEPGQRFAFAFDLQNGEAVRLETAGDDTLDTVVHLFGPGEGGLPIATDDDSGPGRLSILDAVAKTDGRHTVLLTTFQGLGRGTVRLSIRVGGQAGCRPAPTVTAADLQGPTEVDMGPVAQGARVETMLHLRNEGGTDVVVDRVAFDSTGATGFGFTWPCARLQGSATESIAVGPNPGDTSMICAGTVTVPAGGSLPIPVRFTAGSADVAIARLTFHSTDPDALVVTLVANRDGPCIVVLPTPIEIGFVPLGKAGAVEAEIRSCALDTPTRITGLRLEDPTDTRFAVEAFREVSAENPLVLAPDASWTVLVSFVPALPESRASNILLVDSDAPSSPLRIELIGRGGELRDPVCDFLILSNGTPIAEGGAVPVLTELSLADQSYDATVGGALARWTWSVQQPVIADQAFAPDVGSPDVSFKPLMAGEHMFRLAVENLGGRVATCQHTLRAEAPTGWMIVVTWNTPADPDQTDSCQVGKDCGSDMDLHFVHPKASGTPVDPLTGGPYGYFDEVYDTYWMNPHPTAWDVHEQGVPYEPTLDRDDTDGGGPEIVTLGVPDPKLCYRIGVHYFDGHGFGSSYPSVQIWDSNVLIHEVTSIVGLHTGDMWDVGEVCGPEAGGGFVPHENAATGAIVVIPNYPTPF